MYLAYVKTQNQQGTAKLDEHPDVRALLIGLRHRECFLYQVRIVAHQGACFIRPRQEHDKHILGPVPDSALAAIVHRERMMTACWPGPRRTA